MALIEWRDDFSLGIAEVDHEHRELIELINAAYVHMQQDETAGEIDDFLGEIYARISAHFALEEKMMRERGYDQYAEHKSEHETLLDEIRDLMDAYEDGVLTDAPELAARLQAWFTEHFRTHDARLHRELG